MIEALIATVGTIIGTILGFFLSEWSTKRREDRNEKKQAQSVRTLVSLEIDRNLNLLTDYWPRVEQAADPNDDAQGRKIKLASKFIELAFPEWKREILDSQLPLLAMALREQEVVQVLQFYDRLSKVEALRNGLVSAAQEDKEDRRAPVRNSYSSSMAFSRKALVYWDECESTVAQLLGKGNPLKSRK